MAHIHTVRALGVLAGLGFGMQAMAEHTYILRIEGGPTQVDTSTGAVTLTLDVIGDMVLGTEAEFMMWGAFGLETTGSAVVENITWNHADWSEFNHDGGYTNDGNYAQIEYGQWRGLDWTPRDGSGIGNRIGSFQITLAQNADLSGDFSVSLVHGVRYSLSTLNIETGESYYSTPESLALEGYTTNIVPAPGSIAMVMGAGLVCTRRRRAAA